MKTREPSTAPLWSASPAGRHFAEVPVTGLLSGQRLGLPLHWVRGLEDGPVLGVLAGIHGDESFPPLALKAFLDGLEPGRLRGVVVVMPVANPLALAAFSRFTPEHHGNPDLHTSFPGKPDGSLTQMLAAAISRYLLQHVDALVDIHSGGMGGRLQSRTDFDRAATGAVRDESLRLCRAFGLPFIHANDLRGSAVGYVTSLGRPAIGVEVGGAYLGRSATGTYTRRLVEGLEGVLRALGMVASGTEPPFPRQLLFGLEARVEVNPTTGGLLISSFEEPQDIGRRVEAGTLLGEVLDPRTLEVTQRLVAPVDGYLFFSRYSGAVEAGSKGFAIADEANARWLGASGP